MNPAPPVTRIFMGERYGRTAICGKVQLFRTCRGLMERGRRGMRPTSRSAFERPASGGLRPGFFGFGFRGFRMVHPAHEVQAAGHQRGPAGLMARAEAAPVVAIEVFV